MKTALIALAALVTTTTAAATMAPSPDDTVRETVAHVVSVEQSPDLPTPPAPLAGIVVLKKADARALPVFAGYEQAWQQANDAMIVRVVAEFNADHGWSKGHEDYLDPTLVKAWALQESGGHREIFTSGDMMQMNNNGDWAPEKVWFGIARGERLSPEESLKSALSWAYYKGEETKPMRAGVPAAGWYQTTRGGAPLQGYMSRFTSWKSALTRYNGGGVADYHGDIQRRLARSGVTLGGKA